MDAKVRERTQHLDLANHHLDVARTAAESASRAKSAFLANVTHELRTPLASNHACAAILHHYPDEDQATKSDFAEIIVLEAERLTRLIEDLLDVARIEAGAFVVRPSLEELVPILQEAREVFSDQAERGGVKLLVEPHLGARP